MSVVRIDGSIDPPSVLCMPQNLLSMDPSAHSTADAVFEICMYRFQCNFESTPPRVIQESRTNLPNSAILNDSSSSESKIALRSGCMTARLFHCVVLF